MSILGSSQPWYAALVDMYDIIYEAIARVWPECTRRVTRASSMGAAPRQVMARQAHEDPITRYLIMHLRSDPIIRDSPIHIESQRELLSDDPQADPRPIGYLDICVLFLTGSDKLYLAMECKRLNVRQAKNRTATQASEYVTKGMMRFVSGQYSPTWPLGAMLGYVMDGNMQTAYIAIRHQIEQHAQQLLYDPALFRDVKRPEHFSTTHQRPDVPIELRHLLLAAHGVP
jgi:hypothetical protein